MTNDRTATPSVFAAVLGCAAACWVLAVHQMDGMDMGVATTLGSFGAFVSLWTPMMAAMMLPGSIPAVLARADATRRVGPPLRFALTYLCVWTVVGVVVYVLYRPHGTVAAGVLVIAAGIYEATALKQNFRRRCRERLRSGITFGINCVGSTIGLMVVLLALGVMSITWMCAVGLLILAQKLFPVKAAVDVPFAAAIVALGLLIVLAPSVVPGLTPSM